MTYATVMVHAEAAPGRQPRLRFAANVANLFGARLIGVGAEIFAPAFDLASATALALETAGIEDSIEQARLNFASIAKSAQGGSEWRGFVGYPSETVARECRAADLIVAGPSSHRLAAFHTCVEPAELLMRCGRPVLIAPEHEIEIDPTRVLVAWSDTREARRAVTDALPFLRKASQVVMVHICATGGGEDSEGVDDVAAMLQRHGVNAEGVVRPKGGAARAQDLMAVAGEYGAGLLVAGGYGHSRLREWVFGGVTRGLLGACRLPVLLSR